MRLARLVVAAAVLLGGCSWAGPDDGSVAGGPHATDARPSVDVDVFTRVRVQRRRTASPLDGATIVLDPGHQLGNRNFPHQIDRPVPAGGFTKPCNTTGTSTNGGYPEATFAWKVSQQVRRRLESLGARVLLTRTSNSDRRWGPCVDERGRAGNRQAADLELSIHGDGSYAAGAHGFHVIAPTDRRPWTHDIYRTSRHLALSMRSALHRGAGLDYATYTAGGDGLDLRGDLGTLNLSDVPTVMVELGNMRDRGDAALMTSKAGRRTYAEALVRGAQKFLATTPVPAAEPADFSHAG